MHLSDDEIVSSVIDAFEGTDEEEESDNEQDQEIPRINHSTAVKSFDQCLLWMQQQEEASLYNLDVLRELRDFAARKRMNSIQQRTLGDYFPTNN